MLGNDCYSHIAKYFGQVDLAESDENGNENERGNGNGNERGNGKDRQRIAYKLFADLHYKTLLLIKVYV